MKEWLRELLAEQEGGGSPSMTRFLSLVCVAMSCAIAVVCIYKGKNLDSTAILCSVFLGAGLGSKIIQKNIEVNAVEKEDSK